MWLITSDVAERMAAAYKAGVSAEQQAAFVAARMEARRDGSGPEILSLAGDSAEIEVKGVLTKEPDFFAMFFGGGNTTYGDISAALRAAEQDPAVKDITLYFDSPGGTVAGLFDALATMESVSKPMTARVDQAASAAYALAAQAANIVANNISSQIGSIGTAQRWLVSDDVVEIASTAAPKKRPDVRTEEGRAVVREELDAMHQIFAESIAKARGVSVDTVNARFGQGASFFARDALKAGMIDAIGVAEAAPAPSANPTTANTGGTIPEASTMDREKLKAEHPAVFAAVLKEGTDAERDRVVAHMTMGEASGDMATASAAIKDGSGMTATALANYNAASMKRNTIAARQADADEISGALEGAAPAATAAAAAEAKDAAAGQDILNAAAQRLGVSLEVTQNA